MQPLSDPVLVWQGHGNGRRLHLYKLLISVLTN
uniref:Uncharacterized protein n=1 Tax=Arundo donax TaxID=35708 RepID=A0A0A9CUC9_ARUDO